MMWAVKFRMVVFRPFTSEVILAKVKSSDESGVRSEPNYATCVHIAHFTDLPSVSVGFFDDIHIPTAYLPSPSALYVSSPSPSFPLLPPPSPSFHPTILTTHSQRPKRALPLLVQPRRPTRRLRPRHHDPLPDRSPRHVQIR